MSVIAEYGWLMDPTGAVRVRWGREDMLVVESDWADAGGDAAPATQDFGGGFAQTSGTPGVWTTAIEPQPARQEGWISNVASDPTTLLLVSGGPDGPKPLWPDSPAFFTSDWKGAISVMSPTHSSVYYGYQSCG